MLFLTQHINFLYSYFRVNNIVTNIMSTLLWKYSDLRIFLDDKYNHYYDNNKYFKLTMDYSFSMFRYLKRSLITDYILPEEIDWHNYISVAEDDSDYKYSESFEIVSSVINNEREFIESVELSKGFFKNFSNPNLCCLVSKYKDTYIVCNHSSKLKQTDYFQKSNTSILSVVYSHPKMKEKISIDLPKEMLYCHNQLFNAAFVYFCLRYFNKDNFIFDKDYNIEIMDSNVETMNITYEYYLDIGLNQLEVRKI